MKTDFDELLLDESPDAIVATTPEGKVMYWSKVAETVFGHTRAEAAALARCTLTAIFEAGFPSTSRGPQAAPWNGNDSTHMSAKFFDSTVLGRAEKALDFIGNVLESSTEYSVIGKDLDRKIRLWNEGARRIYGYEPREVIGKANAEIPHTPENIALGKAREILDAALRDGKWEGVIGRIRNDECRITARVGTAHRPHPRGTDRHAVQELIHRSDARGGWRQTGAARRQGYQLRVQRAPRTAT
jgi:PAS domain S-box-containing protein